MPDNINEPKSQILNALWGNYSTPQGNIQEPESPILKAIKNGGGGSYDDSELRQRIEALEDLIAKNSGDIDRIADKIGIDLTVEYLPLAQNQGVFIDDGVGIDTGLTLNGLANFTFKGFLKDNQKQVCLIGSRTGTSTTERTCLNVLPQSGQIQSQWASNNYKVVKDEMDLTQPFTVTAKYLYTVITQNDIRIAEISNGGFTGKNTATPICLFNQQLQNAQYYSPVLQRAEIKIDGVVSVFEPKIKRNTETGVESIVMLKNGVEMAIDGLTLFEIQAA